MIALRKGLPLVAGCAMLLSAGTASAQMDLDDWILDLSNLGAGFAGQQTTGPGDLGVDQATFFAPTRVVTSDNDGSGTLSVGDTQVALGIGSITSFVNSSNQVFTNTTDGATTRNLGIGNDFEVTFAFTLNETITSVNPDGLGGENVGFIHTGGSLTLYVDDSPDFNGSDGTGATDGTAIATFSVVPGALGGNINTRLLDGSVDVVFQAESIAAGWLFNGDGIDLSTLVDDEGDPLLIGLSDSNFQIENPNAFNEGGIFDDLGTPYPTEIDLFDFFAEEDGSIDLAVLPEPGTLAVFGLGLLGLGLAVRRRQRANA